MKKVDLLTVGDIVVDAFIKLQDAHIHCNIDKEGCELCMNFGGKIPYESLHIINAAGNSSNVAISTSRLGINTALVANIGDDNYGKDCLLCLKKEGVKTKYITKEKNKLTNYHYVLWYDIDRTILVKHTEFNYKFPKIKNVSWIYLSSLADNSLPYQLEIIEYIKKHPNTKLAFQPGTFQIKLGTEKLKDVYTNTEVFFSNLEEAERILGIEEKDILKLAQGINALGPKIVVLTDAHNGAYLYFNNELWHYNIYKTSNPPFECTGAGDALSSAFMVALILGKTPLESLSWGMVNSMSVIQKIGSQDGLLSREKLEEYLKNAPVDFKATKIN
ncbi:MAG TPA: carbohydrate kinase family protein [Candidatus Paceibacterota bacterium]|nr:carbohydrate kinase family protein [Candidatus Paceibacterota bacterium]HPT17882.1 carbohydrate kinase family protein [Candidatus Paceibacterota bacterium]